MNVAPDMSQRMCECGHRKGEHELMICMVKACSCDGFVAGPAPSLDRAPTDARREAAARLRKAAWSGQDRLTRVVLESIADSIEPDPTPAIDMDGTGYMLDQRALRMAQAILGEGTPHA